MVSNLISISGYHLTQELYNSSRTLVYRGYREADQKPVVIKLLKNLYPSFTELVQFRNQYTIGKNLHQPEIIQTYDLEPYQHSYALVMEDFGGISLKHWWWISERSLREFLVLAIALCNSLDTLYRHRVIHKDIKPSNILINPETKQVKLIDFSIASLLSQETQTLMSPNVLEGTLAYLSPEQTGRMNRGIDYRTDFYSLGVTFYELLTGELPFESNDAMELVHCHIAKQPNKLKIINSKFTNEDIPQVICGIVMKMMAKNAEDRYQSALGLKYDLEICLSQIQESGKIQNFQIAQRDVSDRFIIPEKLYGRDREVQTLLAAFERVANNQRELMLVAGFSGIGKTAIVNEVHKPIVRQRGYFIKGKFDQFNRNIPFSAFVQALRDLMGQLSRESDVQLETWKLKILAALADNGQVIIEVIPELEQIIGQQPAVSGLSGTAAQNRFNLLFQKFIQVFTTKEHPLVIFLDDLQWADLASLKLIQLLMSESKCSYLLLIGAYRDNEVSAMHPLMLTLADISKAQTIINTITLMPLSQSKLNQLVTETLKCTENLALPLSQLIYQKTQGNPFFITQFLKALHQHGLIQFNFEAACWECDITQVSQQAITDDVVEFMALQLKKLSQSTQEILKLAACIGNQFDLETLAIIAKKSQIETATCLWKALQEGLILPQTEVYKFYQQESFVPSHSLRGGVPLRGSKLRVASRREAFISLANREEMIVGYKFLHDRVQQAAYSLIAKDQKPQFHYTLGQLLLQNTSDAEQEEKLFDIVNHLNMGSFQITETTERLKISQLNLLAGQKAKLSTAYQAGVLYLSAGIKLLPLDSWESDYHLTFSLYRECIECQYLAGDFEAAETLVATTLNNARSQLDKAAINAIRLIQYQNSAIYEKAIQIGLESLKMLGLELPIAPNKQTITLAAQAVAKNLGDRQIASLAVLPQMENNEQQMLLLLLINLIPPTYIANQDLMVLVILKMTNLCLQYGNTPLSSFVYLWYATVLCSIFEEYEKGDSFGALGLQLNEQANILAIKGKAYMTFGSFVSHWRRPLPEGLETIKQSFYPAMEAGELSWCFHGGSFNFWKKFLVCDRLDDLAEEQKRLVEFAEKIEPPAALALAIQHQVLANLQGTISDRFSLNDETFNETSTLKVFADSQYAYGMSTYYFAKAFLHYSYGDYATAYQLGLEAEKTHGSLYGQFQIILHDFYQALSIIQLYVYGSTSETLQHEYLEKLQKYSQKFKMWADNCPENYLAFSLLLEAEIARISEYYGQAVGCYDRAIAIAKANKYLYTEALANELTARLYLEWGKERIAQEYLFNAYYCYVRWGAKAKVDDLEKRYPQLLAPILQQREQSLNTTDSFLTLSFYNNKTSTSDSISETLDLATVLKASQTLSSEIELEKLLATLLQVMIENAGAEKCVLMLLRHERLLIKGIVSAGMEPIVLPQIPVEESQDIPLELVYSVKHSLEPTVLFDATADPRFASDPYILSQQPKSILCSPILLRGRFAGIVYLENNLTTGAFTSDRVNILNLLCTQAAISLENARLYAHEQEKSQVFQESLHRLQQSEMRFKELFEKSADAILLLGSDGFIDCNQATVELFGYSHKGQFFSIHPSHISTEFQPDGQSSFDKANAMISKALQTGCYQFEWMHQRANGKEFWAEVMLTVISYDGEQVLHSVVRDISERKQAEEEIKESKAFLNQVINVISDIIFVKDEQHRWVLANQSLCDLLGVDCESILGKSDYDFFLKEHADVFWEKDNIVFQSQTEQVNEELITDNKGQIHWLLTKKSRFENNHGQAFIVGSSRDITELKQVEAQLRQQEQFLRSIYDGAEMVIFVIDVLEDGSFCYAGWNAASERVIGIRGVDAVGKTPTEIMGEEQGEILRQQFAERVRTGMPISYEECLTINGEKRWWWVNLNPLRNEEGRIYRIIGTTFDISDRKRAETELQQAQLQIVQSEKMSALGNLVAGVAHEINNPVGFIAGNLQPALDYINDTFKLIDLYQQEYPNPSAAIQDEIKIIDLEYVREDLPKLIASMKLGIDRICEISNSLRTFSRADRDRKISFNIHEGIDSTILILRHRLKANGNRPEIEVVKKYGNLPQIECFPGQLNQVFMNIVANAIDALEESNQGRSVTDIKTNPNRITITTYRGQQKTIVVKIADNGTGMPEERRERIFDNLFTTKTVGKGTGLGLAIARQIVEDNHRGNLSCNSILGKGTEFVIEIPVF
ncbi:PAS domain S-box protein [uncultured Nostoc sp.]|uniref:PAS domain S-box protein n=1 Tax=uncultured Nostoc sp. TaxID=340711 RepID=UPI0035C9CD26